MDYHSLLKKVEHYALDSFDHTALDLLPYHNRKHTESVVSSAKQMARHYQLNERDFFIVAASAWLHDLDYTIDRLNHEANGRQQRENSWPAMICPKGILKQSKIVSWLPNYHRIRIICSNVGQSIAPKKPFLKEYLQMIKRWQLESMINIVQVTEEMKSSMAFLLQTTQLLFVHPQTIDITFRKDERRFDVEGAYNIRYHIIKKRIDKVVILDSDERLTQPGKIALVYFDDRDAKEYKDYIKELQVQNLLLDDLEELDLEALQGVNGLKALRVGVRL